MPSFKPSSQNLSKTKFELIDDDMRMEQAHRIIKAQETIIEKQMDTIRRLSDKLTSEEMDEERAIMREEMGHLGLTLTPRAQVNSKDWMIERLEHKVEQLKQESKKSADTIKLRDQEIARLKADLASSQTENRNIRDQIRASEKQMKIFEEKLGKAYDHYIKGFSLYDMYGSKVKDDRDDSKMNEQRTSQSGKGTKPNNNKRGPKRGRNPKKSRKAK